MSLTSDTLVPANVSASSHTLVDEETQSRTTSDLARNAISSIPPAALLNIRADFALDASHIGAQFFAQDLFPRFSASDFDVAPSHASNITLPIHTWLQEKCGPWSPYSMHRQSDED